MFFNGRQCPICRSKFERFSPLDEGYMRRSVESGFSHPFDEWELLNIKEYCCPNCGASDRERLIAIYIRKNIKLIRGKSVVEFAPGVPITKLIKDVAPSRYRSIDKYMDNVDLRLDLTDLSELSSGSVDFFVCSHVLEHIDDDIRALSELKRILSANGKGVLVVPISKITPNIVEDSTKVTEAERWSNFGQGDHVRIYNRDGFIHRIKSVGLKVSLFRSWAELSFISRKKFGIQSSGVIYIVSK